MCLTLGMNERFEGIQVSMHNVLHHSVDHEIFTGTRSRDDGTCNNSVNLEVLPVFRYH